MNLSTLRSSWLKAFAPWLIALLCFAAIEFAIRKTQKPLRFDRNNFLEYRYAAPESVQRMYVHDKMKYLAPIAPSILHVGDSSGLHGAVPAVIESYLPGHRYLNMGVATNLGYSGYYEIARNMLARHKTIKHLVLYTTFAGGQPRKSLWRGAGDLLAGDIERNFNSPFDRFFQLPSLALREPVTDFVFYLNGAFRVKGEPRTTNEGYLGFAQHFRESGGWNRETDTTDDEPGNLWASLDGMRANNNNTAIDPAIRRIFARAFPIRDEKWFDIRTMSYASWIEYILGEFNSLAKSHGATLVVLPNPVPASMPARYDATIFDFDSMVQALRRFKASHPEAVVPSDFPLMADEKFSVFSHVATPFNVENSHRIGQHLKDIVGQGPFQPAHRPIGASLPEQLSIDFGQVFHGYGWQAVVKTNGVASRTIRNARGQGLVYFALKPGSAYDLTVSFDAGVTLEAAQSVHLNYNNVALERTGSVLAPEGPRVTWRVPALEVSKLQGWSELLVSIDPASAWTFRRPATSVPVDKVAITGLRFEAAR